MFELVDDLGKSITQLYGERFPKMKDSVEYNDKFY